MISQNPRLEIYDPKTLAAMDKAFHAVWQVLTTGDPFRDYANDSELRVTIGRRLMELVANGIVEYEVAKAAANNPSDFELKVKTLA